jgi:DNA-binding transcriptional regulator YdaS (Cro superfamily)
MAAGVDTPEAVTNWKRRGIPPEHCLAIQKATKGEVTVHDLRPDVFGEAAAT